MTNMARRNSIYGFLFWVALAAIGSFMIMPLKKHLRFGIDLVGGFYITLKVNTQEAVKAELLDIYQRSVNQLQKHSLNLPVSKSFNNHNVVMTFAKLNDAQSAVSFLRGKELKTKINQENETVSLYLSEQEVERIKNWSVENNIEVLRKRLDATGVAEIAVSRQGVDDIIIELPNVDDPARAKEMIGRAAQLEFKLVHGAGRNEDDILDKTDGIVPDGMMLLPGQSGGSESVYLVTEDATVTGRHLKDARPVLGGRTGTEPSVSFELTPDGGDAFYELTSANRGRRLAIVLDGKVISAPGIQADINHAGTITGDFTWEAAQDLSTLLKTGAFVAPVTFEEERRIGPSLGMESIKQGVMSCVIGLSLLFVFSLLWYRTSGLLAFIALLYNLLLIIFTMVWLKATLTMPGIAGMVLTVGMAIDSSILIYEKMKELLASGYTFRKSLEMGFSAVMVIILDANITTFLVGVVLYKFGTGPVQGFAVTMMLGIIATVITGLFFLKSLLYFTLDVTNSDKLSI